MGNISTKDILYMIKKILIHFNTAHDILGTSIKALKGKKVWKSGDHVQLEIDRITSGFIYR